MTERQFYRQDSHQVPDEEIAGIWSRWTGSGYVLGTKGLQSPDFSRRIDFQPQQLMVSFEQREPIVRTPRNLPMRTTDISGRTAIAIDAGVFFSSDEATQRAIRRAILEFKKR